MGTFGSNETCQSGSTLVQGVGKHKWLVWEVWEMEICDKHLLTCKLTC